MGRLSRTAAITAAALFLETSAYYLLFGIVANLLGLPGAGLSFWVAFLALLWVLILSLYVQTLRFTANLRGVLGLAVSIMSFLFFLFLDSGLSLGSLGAAVTGDAASAFGLALSVGFPGCSVVARQWPGPGTGGVGRGPVLVPI